MLVDAGCLEGPFEFGPFDVDFEVFGALDGGSSARDCFVGALFAALVFGSSGLFGCGYVSLIVGVVGGAVHVHVHAEWVGWLDACGAEDGHGGDQPS